MSPRKKRKAMSQAPSDAESDSDSSDESDGHIAATKTKRKITNFERGSEIEALDKLQEVLGEVALIIDYWRRRLRTRSVLKKNPEKPPEEIFKMSEMD